jgi:hypothetical protein
LPPAPPVLNSDVYFEALTELGRAMVDDDSKVCDDRPEILLDAGYTYFGQFVAHDLTKDVSSIEEAATRPLEELENLQTPRLDLDVLYGGGPSHSPELYKSDGIRLKVGTSSAATKAFDICVGKCGERVIADDRGAENLILRQMTSVFARFHNFAVEQLEQECDSEAIVFERARQQMRWQFQYLVVHDYLRSVLEPSIFRKVFVVRKPRLRWSSFSIPIEFSAAAMRFGHAMVRPNYLFAFGQEMLLQNMFGRNGDLGSLKDDLKIEWGFFFQGAGPVSALTSRPIDTRLSPGFQQLPEDLIGAPIAVCPHLKKRGNFSQLAVRTLLRGAGLRLASGQTVAAAFGEPVLTEDDVIRNAYGELTNQGRILRRATLRAETPLWYYILKESETLQNGNVLGPTGSHIVAETIYAALLSDTTSYLYKPERLPPAWKALDDERIYSLGELFRFAALL